MKKWYFFQHLCVHNKKVCFSFHRFSYTSLYARCQTLKSTAECKLLQGESWMQILILSSNLAWGHDITATIIILLYTFKYYLAVLFRLYFFFRQWNALENKANPHKKMYVRTKILQIGFQVDMLTKMLFTTSFPSSLVLDALGQQPIQAASTLRQWANFFVLSRNRRWQKMHFF